MTEPAPAQRVRGLVLLMTSVTVFGLSLVLTFVAAAIWQQNGDMVAFMTAIVLPVVGPVASAILFVIALVVSAIDLRRAKGHR